MLRAAFSDAGAGRASVLANGPLGLVKGVTCMGSVQRSRKHIALDPCGRFAANTELVRVPRRGYTRRRRPARGLTSFLTGTACLTRSTKARTSGEVLPAFQATTIDTVGMGS